MNVLYFLFGLLIIGFGGWIIYNREKPLNVVFGLMSIFLGAVMSISILSGDFGNDDNQEESNYYYENDYNRGSYVNFEANEWIPVEVYVNRCDGYGGSLCSCKKYKGFKQAGLDRYSGECSNYAGGHRCGHGPLDHGLPE